MNPRTSVRGACPRREVLSESIAEVLGSGRRKTNRRNNAGVVPAILSASGGALLAAALVAVPSTRAFAQDDQQLLEEVTVTGSRIPRRDFTANSPITTLDQQTFQTTSTIGVETVLNQLPQFVPAVTQFTTTDVQQTATNTVGASTVSLRGLGPNRNLVLLNGKRAMPVNAGMVVDTNMIPSSAIARVEVISGGASAVYGADAVGGVVNFVLKDDFEGASVEMRIGDTQHGGNQEVTISGLIGANVAGDRGNVMLGVERSSRSLVGRWERDWRVEDMANPSTPATAFFWGTDTWISTNAFNFGFLPSQASVDALFNQVPAGSVPNNARLLVNRNDGTVYGGLMNSAGAAGSYRYSGPYTNDYSGAFPGLPFRVVQPDGTIKENNFWQWASTPLERLSAFANGHFDVTDNIRVTAQALVSRTETQTSLGLTADNITFWGATIPFGMDAYTGDPANGIPNPLNSDGTTNGAYLPGGRFGVNCDAAPSAAEPWHDGLPGCTQTEAWPVTPDIWSLYYDGRLGAGTQDFDLWANRPPDYLRDALGAARSSTNTLTTTQFSLGVEGDLPSGNDFWDVTFSTGRTDNLVIQRGSTRLSTYRRLMGSPNYGRGAIFDPNPYVVGFAESIATCTSGLPIIDDRQVSKDCAVMISPNLKNKSAVTQAVFEANLVGDLAEMPHGPLQYALGTTYRENSYVFEPDNLSQNQNFIDPIAGLFPNEDSGGKFDVAEIYGELLIPIVSDGPVGDFNVELGGRISQWSMDSVDKVETYKALIDWAMTPKYRLRGGFNRALRAPNLGELYSGRTQIFGGVGNVYGDQCSQLNTGAPFSPGNPNASAQQRAQSQAICEALMTPAGAQEYYVTNGLNQPNPGGIGIQNGTGNPNLREEAADTFTLGMVMDVADNWTLTVDYYSIEIKDMIAIESGDAVYQRCLSTEFNPNGDPNSPACMLIFRNPGSGAAANIDLSYTNQGRAKMEGVDLNLNWTKMMSNGGFNMNMVANYVLASETQDRPDLQTTDWAGTDGCSLQIQCQGYDYRVFTTFNYFRGNWNVSLRHQYWPSLMAASCLTSPTANSCLSGGVQESYQLFALSASYAIGDKYTVRFGMENLFDKEPPCTGGNPTNPAFPIPCTRGGGFGGTGAATYDPLGRRGFISMSMDF